MSWSKPVSASPPSGLPAVPAAAFTATELPALLPPPAPTRTCDAFLQTCRGAPSIFEEWRRAGSARFVGFGCDQQVLSLSDATVGNVEDWFFVGDIHGDFYALYNCVEYVKRLCADFRLVFLGDLVDRGKHSIQCLWYILDLAARCPDRILWLAGNHDVGIAHGSSRHTFRSTVSPSEFAEELNRLDELTPLRYILGEEFIRLVAALPRAALFPDGLLATHGGFPHTDLLSELGELSDTADKVRWLNDSRCLKDFTWTRISRYPRKIPNRTTAGCSYGFRDFEAFQAATREFFPVARLITGHDHPEQGFDTHPTWVEAPALTISGLGFGDNYDEAAAYSRGYRDYLVVARHRRDRIPEVIKIPVDRDDLDHFYDSTLSVRFSKGAIP